MFTTPHILCDPVTLGSLLFLKQDMPYPDSRHFHWLGPHLPPTSHPNSEIKHQCQLLTLRHHHIQSVAKVYQFNLCNIFHMCPLLSPDTATMLVQAFITS